MPSDHWLQPKVTSIQVNLKMMMMMVNKMILQMKKRRSTKNRRGDDAQSTACQTQLKVDRGGNSEVGRLFSEVGRQSLQEPTHGPWNHGDDNVGMMLICEMMLVMMIMTQKRPSIDEDELMWE